MLDLVRRPYGERSVGVLRLLRAVIDTLHDAPRMVRGRLSTLVLLTVLVWLLEVAAVAVAVPGLGADLSRLTTAMLSVLSGVSSGATALTPGFGESLARDVADLGDAAGVGVYRLAIVLPVLALGAAGSAAHLRTRRLGTGA